MTRRQAVLLSFVPGLLSAQNGWALRFVRVNDRVEIRSGGPRGPLLVSCDQRGRPDFPFGSGEPAVSLYGRATSRSGYGECWIDVLFGGRRVASWQFKGEQFRQFQR